jgi:DNA (cytosine-5)-methyltransferase 1
MVPNHYSATLSELDLAMVRAVPSGGNWKDIPTSIPSRRLQQIRESYAAGEGSRSTYYGRLKPDAPSYTITTYFNRPGNGCYIHYDVHSPQHRLISQREGARLQSFPDSFHFFGSKAQVYKQIGNAVPPLLAYQIASQLGPPGVFVDLFSGAGGISQGFHWAGWKGILASDIEPSYLATYKQNLGGDTLAGDISDPTVLNEIVGRTLTRLACGSEPFYVLGGPPCQGFSTAGNARSMDDARNHLFHLYAEVLQKLRPQGFVFENVPGLLNMQGGSVFRLITETLAQANYKVQIWNLHAQNFGVPQRRNRIFIVGSRPDVVVPIPPPSISRFGAKVADLFDDCLPTIIGVRDAIGDLPAIGAGEDGSTRPYRRVNKSPYQSLMRGEISAESYIRGMRIQERLNDSNK